MRLNKRLHRFLETYFSKNFHSSSVTHIRSVHDPYIQASSCHNTRNNIVSGAHWAKGLVISRVKGSVSSFSNVIIRATSLKPLFPPKAPAAITLSQSRPAHICLVLRGQEQKRLMLRWKIHFSLEQIENSFRQVWLSFVLFLSITYIIGIAHCGVICGPLSTTQ